MRNFHLPGRSPVHARRAMCATSHPQASATAIEVLGRGGNAVDAAIAACAVLCVVEHPMTGIGGDCFALVLKPGATEPIALSAAGRAPAAATPARYAKAGITEIAQQSPHAVTVPGAVDGWARLLADHGTMSLADVLEPAIALAREGFAVAPRVAHDWAKVTAKLAASPGAAANLLVGGRAPRAGEVFRMPALARTLERIAAGGRDAFYMGEVAADMVATLRGLGGLHTIEDFARQRSSYVTPIRVGYKGVDLWELPPSNQGVVALILLRMLERIGPLPADPADAERIHVMLEAARLAYAVRDAFLADPEAMRVPLEHMLSDVVTGELVGRIDRRRRTADLGPAPRPAGTDTTYLSVVDGAGMAVSFINSLFAACGSGIATLKTGIVLQNRGQGFVLDPAHPNAIGPGKRPLHTLVPAIATKDGALWASFGVMGGGYQPAGHVQVLTNMLDCGLDPQAALDAPRVFFDGADVLYEDGVPEATRHRLGEMGHVLKRRDDPWGGGQIVLRQPENGVLVGASDHRKDGLALGY
jgi:gamma-glutamyltranspeptidase/glutathione hydrolase